MNDMKIKKVTVLILIIIITITMFFGCSTNSTYNKADHQIKNSFISMKEIKKTKEKNSDVKSTDDYYAAVNKKVLEEHQIDENTNWNWFFDLEEKAYNEKKKIIQTAAKKVKQQQNNLDTSSLEYKIGTLYLLAMNQKERDKYGIKYYNELMQPVMNANTIQEFMNELAVLQYHYGFDTLLNTEVLALDENPSEYIISVKDFNYIVDILEFQYDDSEEENIAYFNDYLGKLLNLCGRTETEAKKNTTELFQFVKDIAKSKTEGKLQPISVENLQKIITNVNLKQYLDNIYKVSPNKLYITETDSLKKLNKYLTNDNIALLKNYVYIVNIEKFADFMTSDMREAKRKMEEDYIGEIDTFSTEKLAVTQVASLLNWEIGKLYTEKNFNEEKQKKLQNIVNLLVTEYKTMLQEQTWLSKETKQKALKKLEQLKIRIGIPNDISKYLSNYTPILHSNGGSYLSNVLQIRKEKTEKQYDSYGKNVDRSIWNILPQEITPCYYPTDNSINIPIAVLEEPYFSVTASEEENLGAIGMIIAHEITHAFDDLGSKYDENGNYVDWWTPEDSQSFEKLAEKIIVYYDNYKTPDIMKQDGKQTLGENIADIGAMCCVSRIIEKNNLSPEKFFESYANAWASISDTISMAIISGMDEHAADKVRVNAVLSSCELFYKTYDIKKGDDMYIEPEKRVKLW